MCGAILNDRTNLHFTDIASKLTPANHAMNNLMIGMTHRLGSVLGSPEAGHSAALGPEFLHHP